MGRDGKRQKGEERKCQKARAAGMTKKIVVVVRGDRNVDGYFKRQT